MKLIRYGEIGNEKPGIHLDGINYSISHFVEDFNEDFFTNNGINRLELWINENQTTLRELPEDIRIGPPVARPSKIVCVGLNYAAHARESGLEPPNQPVLFFKSTTAICGPFDDVIIPPKSFKTDWEVELAVVIGRKTQYVDQHEAMDYIAGFLIHNDYSERTYQLEQGGQWVKGKSCDTFAPLGPYLVTKDEIHDPHNLDLWLTVNGVQMQNSNTSDMIFNVPELVSYISQYMTLLPGDIISTGTPFGVGLGLNPPVYLKPGDVVKLGINGLGECEQNLVSFDEWQSKNAY